TNAVLAESVTATVANLTRNIQLNGNARAIPKRAFVLVFDSTNWNLNQIVNLGAVNDGLDEGDRVVVASHSVLSDDPTFDHALVRNVEVRVHDNDHAGIALTQVDPFPSGGLAKYNNSPADNNTVVLEGDATTGVIDAYAVELQKAPAVGQFVTVAIKPTDPRVYLTSTDPVPHSGPANRFVQDTAVDAVTPGIYHVTFDHDNWNKPVLITVHAVN